MTLEQEEKIFQQWNTTNKPLPEIAEAVGVRYCEAAEYINTIITEQERMDRNDRCKAASKPERREPWQDNETKADKKASRRGKPALVPLKINSITGQPSTEIENMVAEAEQKLEQAAETLIKVQAEIGEMKAQIRAEVIAEIKNKLQI